MMDKELNHKIKRLYLDYKKREDEINKMNIEDQWDPREDLKIKIGNRLRDLYTEAHNAGFETINKNSLLILLSLNRTFRVIAFHMFGYKVDLESLIN